MSFIKEFKESEKDGCAFINQPPTLPAYSAGNVLTTFKKVNF